MLADSTTQFMSLAPRRSRFARSAAALILTALAPVGFAQWLNYPTANVPRTPDGKPNLMAPAPRTADGKPDLSGMWGWETRPPCGAHCNDLSPGWAFMNLGTHVDGGIPHLPATATLVRKRAADLAKDDPNVHCQPRGAVRILTDDYYKRIIQAPDRLVVLTERNMAYRQIFTDGRPLPQDPDPTWNGYSAGKWDGDTLVVQTIGFRDGLWLDSQGNPLGSKGKVTEKFRRPNYGTLQVDITIDDPSAYSAPWSVQLNQPIVLDSELIDYFCENEKVAPHMVGR